MPLGKAGATKRQHFTLGHGTSQHVLIAGRTGSGKSTLMHALITNLALNYSPDEIDLYLIDFKKGVEFKVYATHELPHASVVAIESEREFGISVLERLDAELRLRADRFRDAGVQDVNGYRNVPGTPPLPRILLIVDEFQEFFVEEDKLAQEAALWLDRLVRQGRAFGIHVILGSQSLGGAFTLARSTLGQMAVRIALQCSENDAHLILSENNIAPRMLSRPGEAIYNDANGAPEGNHFFQVVWLSDERREAYLKQLHERAQEQKPILSRTPIVFEGDAPADLARNPLLRSRLDSPTWPESPRSAQAWVGDAISIKDPTSALFRRQGGNHLLIVGQNEEAALGVIDRGPDQPGRPVSAGRLRHGPPGGPFLRARRHARRPSQCGRARPRGRRLAARGRGRRLARGAARSSPTVAAEVKRRQEAKTDGPELFLFIHDLPRFRDLRRREDDFSFSRKDDEDAAPPTSSTLILREGPVLGVHLITWCDTVNNLNRYFTHQILREFEMRVLFQMSPTDSGHMLDAPHASKLGPHRAFFASEEQNRLEKFRPYGIPRRRVAGLARQAVESADRAGRFSKPLRRRLLEFTPMPGIVDRWMLAAVLVVATVFSPVLAGFAPVGGDPELLYQPIKSELGALSRPGGCRSGAAGSAWESRWLQKVTSRRSIPPTGLFYRLLHTGTAYRLALWLHMIALAATSFAYARALGIGPPGSALAAASFALCGFQAIHDVHEPFYCVLPYLPLCLLMADRYATTGRLAWLAGLALAWGIQLTLGHFQIQMWTAGLVMMTGVCRVLTGSGDERSPPPVGRIIGSGDRARLGCGDRVGATAADLGADRGGGLRRGGPE